MSGKAILYKGEVYRGGISSELVNKIGSATLTTTAPDLSGAVNELNSGKANKATTLLGYGITDAKIENGVITLGSNSITPLTSASTLNAAKLSGTIPSECYTDTNNAVTQTATDSTSGTYELLFSGTADNTTRTEGVRKSSNITCNPSASTIEIKDNTHRVTMLAGGLSYITVLSASDGLSQTTKRQWVDISDKDISIGGSSDVAVANRTWDGTNTSLKSALGGKVSKSGDTMTGALNFANNTWNKVGDDVQIGDRNVGGGLGIQGLNGNTNIRFYKYGDASLYGNLQFDGGSFYFDKQLIISENNFQLRRTGVEVGKTSNNNVSAYQETNFYNTDKNNYWFTRVCSNAETNGNLSLHLQSRNTKTDGTVVQNNLQLGVKKDGTRIVAITDAGVWRSALGLGSIATKNTGDYLPISGGTLTGNTFVKRASGESEIGATNTASGKNVYLYAADGGTVGVYSNIGAALVAMDTSKKLYLNGTTYSVANADKFRSALGLGAMATASDAMKNWLQYDSWGAVGIATGSSTWKKVVGFTITNAGWYLCHICVTFPTNANGKLRQICLSAKGSTTNSLGYAFYDNRPPMGIGETKCHLTCWAYFEANGTYNILAAHDAGSTLNVTPRMYAARFT